MKTTKTQAMVDHIEFNQPKQPKQFNQPKKHVKKKKIFTGQRINYKPHELPRKNFKEYVIRYMKRGEEESSLIKAQKTFKYLKEAREFGIQKFYTGMFINLTNHKGTVLPL